jgi:hypothetical protein
MQGPEFNLHYHPKKKQVQCILWTYSVIRILAARGRPKPFLEGGSDQVMTYIIYLDKLYEAMKYRDLIS